MSLYIQQNDELVNIATGGGQDITRFVNVYDRAGNVNGLALVCENEAGYAITPIAPLATGNQLVCYSLSDFQEAIQDSSSGKYVMMEYSIETSGAPKTERTQSFISIPYNGPVFYTPQNEAWGLFRRIFFEKAR